MKEKTHQNLPQTPQAEPSGCLTTLVRLLWLAFGNAALAVMTGLIVQKGTFSPLDILFWAIPGLLVLIRYYDITRLHGLTAECEPATLKHWSRYSILLLMTSALLWIFAHTIRLIIGR